jgi:hypothetical protein
MGYNYLAVGGMVPLKTPQIKACLQAIRLAIPATTRLHILGFAKADDVESFLPFGITSFDTTSPLIRAFKDSKANYYAPGSNGRLTYYTAIRIPQATENTKLVRLAKSGFLNQETLLQLEDKALGALRRFDSNELDIERTLEAVLNYAAHAVLNSPQDTASGGKRMAELRSRYFRTLQDRPWKCCSCAVCRALSIDVVIFRASNRNKRRGIHNLGVYKALIDSLPERAHHEALGKYSDISSHSGKAELLPHSGLLCGPRL